MAADIEAKVMRRDAPPVHSSSTLVVDGGTDGGFSMCSGAVSSAADGESNGVKHGMGCGGYGMEQISDGGPLMTPGAQPDSTFLASFSAADQSLLDSGTPLKSSSDVCDSGCSSHCISTAKDDRLANNYVLITRIGRPNRSLIARHATSILRINERAVRGLSLRRGPCPMQKARARDRIRGGVAVGVLFGFMDRRLHPRLRLLRVSLGLCAARVMVRFQRERSLLYSLNLVDDG